MDVRDKAQQCVRVYVYMCVCVCVCVCVCGCAGGWHQSRQPATVGLTAQAHVHNVETNSVNDTEGGTTASPAKPAGITEAVYVTLR